MESLIAERVEAVLRKRHKAIPASLLEKLGRPDAQPVRDEDAA
jgi:hypothetical protein